MRVSIVSANVSPLARPGEPGWCGQAVRVAELADALAESGHEVTVLARRDSPARPVEARPRPGLTIRHVDAGPVAHLPPERLVAAVPELAGRLEELWRAEPPDLVHAHHWTSGLAVGAAVRDVGAATVQTFHTLTGAGPGGRVSAEQAVARSADRVVAFSEDELFSLLRRGAPRSRVRVVPAGLDTAAWLPDGPSLRRTGRPRLLTLAGPDADGGVDEVVQALRGVPDAELFVAGGPAPEHADDDPDLARLCAVAGRAGVRPRVRFLGAVGRDDVPRLLRSCDVLLSAPRRESSGTAALEAMACGRAVVATAVGGQRDAVVDQVTGMQVSPGRPSELAAAVREVLAEASTFAGFGIAGRDRVTSRFARARIVESITTVYREALAERATADTAGVASG